MRIRNKEATNRIRHTKSRLCWSALVPSLEFDKAAVESVRISTLHSRMVWKNMSREMRIANSSLVYFFAS